MPPYVVHVIYFVYGSHYTYRYRAICLGVKVTIGSKIHRVN